MALVLWGGATARTLRAHWALKELGVPYAARLIGPRTGETQTPAFRALNPKEKVPVLVDGDLVLTESAAIVTYLGDKHGGLTPKPGGAERARYDEWMSFILMELDAHTLYVIRKHSDLAALYGEAPAAVEAAREGFAKQIRWAEGRLGDAPHALGGAFSGVDILLVSCLDWARAVGLPLAPALDAYRLRHHGRRGYRQAAALNSSIKAGA